MVPLCVRTQGQQWALSDNPLLLALWFLEVTRAPPVTRSLRISKTSLLAWAQTLLMKGPPRAIWGRSIILLLLSRGGLPFFQTPQYLLIPPSRHSPSPLATQRL